MSKLCASTRFCARAMAEVTMPCSMTSPSSHAHLLHQHGDALAAEQAHQVVFERQEEARGARVALAAGATAQLPVDAPRLVAFGAEDVQPAQVGDAGPELDVGAAAGHVGGDRDRAASGRRCETISASCWWYLALSTLCLHAADLEHARQQLAHLDRDRAHQHRLAALVAVGDLVDHGLVLLALGAIDDVVLVRALTPAGSWGSTATSSL